MHFDIPRMKTGYLLYFKENNKRKRRIVLFLYIFCILNVYLCMGYTCTYYLFFVFFFCFCYADVYYYFCSSLYFSFSLSPTPTKHYFISLWILKKQKNLFVFQLLAFWPTKDKCLCCILFLVGNAIFFAYFLEQLFFVGFPFLLYKKSVKFIWTLWICRILFGFKIIQKNNGITIYNK